MKAFWVMLAAGLVGGAAAVWAEEGEKVIDGESLAAQVGDAAAARELMAAVQGSVPRNKWGLSRMLIR